MAPVATEEKPGLNVDPRISLTIKSRQKQDETKAGENNTPLMNSEPQQLAASPVINDDMAAEPAGVTAATVLAQPEKERENNGEGAASQQKEVTGEIAGTATPAAVPAATATAEAKPDTGASLYIEPLVLHPLLSIEAGATWLTGWKTGEQKEAGGWNAVLGLNYYYPLTQKITLSAGLQYNSVGNLSTFSHTSKVTRYGTGEDSRVTVITPERLHYVVAPLKINYHLNSANIIGIGCNVAYLLDVTSKVETYHWKLNKREDEKITRAHGYSEGFSAMDTQFSIFYRRQIFKSLSVNTEVIMGVTDLKDDAFFKSGGSQSNRGVKITLIYNLLNR
jgi:hypothetical protein